MRPTEFVYSSHDRCEYIHHDWIVRRALESADNRTVFYLPVSSPSRGDQEYSWGTFRPYFERFARWGLQARHFYWAEDLRREDADVFFDWLANSQVVVLGGGMTTTGLQRYTALGGRYYDDPDRFARVLRERQARGMYTVGFSAGADQLCEWSCDGGLHCLGQVARTIVRLHFEPGKEGRLVELAREYRDSMVFGLPNDSGIASAQGKTPGGAFYQFLWFVTDNSWDRPQDHFHIKTRWGIPIQYRSPEGREWRFNGGDVMLRILHDNGARQEAFVTGPHYDSWLDFWTGASIGHPSVDEILGSR